MSDMSLNDTKTRSSLDQMIIQTNLRAKKVWLVASYIKMKRFTIKLNLKKLNKIFLAI